MRVRAAGDAALLVQADDLAGRLAAAIAAQRIAGVLDVVPGASTVLVTTEPGRLDLGALADRVLALPLPETGSAAAPLAEFPVVYDGPDLDDVARLTGLPVREVIARHAAAEYTVGWMGFSPGFGYLTGLDPALAAVPRLAEPRLRVPAGTVAIAGGLAAVYSSDSPGGWRLLGRTPAVLWDPERDPPALLTPGTRVRFRPVTPAPAATTSRDGPAGDGPAGDGPAGDGPAGDGAAGDGAAGDGAVVEVVRPGPLATVQDLGRPGLGHLGVPHAGAADAASLRRANRLVGNPDGAAGLELTLGRAVLRFPGGAWVAVTGAVGRVTMTAEPDAARPVEHGAAFWVPAGGVVQVGAPQAGLRSYVAVRGGIDVPAVLGSRSADLRSRLGPAPLRPGDRLPVGPSGPADGPAATDAATTGEAGSGPPASEARAGEVRAGEAPASVATAGAEPRTAGQAAAQGQDATVPVPGEPAALTVIPGPRDDWFAPGALEALCGADYVVTPASDRTGLRLDGPVLKRARDDELPSEGVVTGALQVPPGGQPILLLADRPVTGGYPVIAVVAAADVGLAAQLRPGSRLRFTLARPPLGGAQTGGAPPGGPPVSRS
jgi:KipI family sensor histidine kinase inhibitor